MNEQNYWTGLYRKRLSRRRLLAGTALGAVGVAGLAMVGCGGDDDGGSVTQPSATGTGSTPAPKRGGVWRAASSFDPPTIDPFRNPSGTTKSWIAYAYSTMFRIQRGPGVEPTSIEPEGDVVESYEVTPDGLTWSFKLKSAVRFHPPLDRAATAEDVVFSFDRFAGKLPGFPAVGNAMNLTNWVESWKATDARTVVLTLKRPYAALLATLSDAQYLVLMPKETGQAFDPAKTMVGSGPWVFDGYTPGVAMKFRRNPSWHFGPDVPYLDTVEISIIKERAAQLVQFLGGNLDTTSENANQLQQILSTIKDVQVNVQEGSNLWWYVAFSLDDGGAPYLDPRVRQAVSLAIDRDAMIEASYDVSKLQSLGFNASPLWTGYIPSVFREYWVDPKEDPKLAPYFKYDLEKAKALLADAGQASGFSAPLYYAPAFGGDYKLQAELILQSLGRVGINLEGKAQEVTDYLRTTAVGNFDGMAYAAMATNMDPGDYLFQTYSRNHPFNRGKVNDPEAERKIGDIMSTLDVNQRKQMIRDFQTWIVDKMYYVPGTSGAIRLTFYQPNVKNAVEYMNYPDLYGSQSGQVPYVWKDA